MHASLLTIYIFTLNNSDFRKDAYVAITGNTSLLPRLHKWPSPFEYGWLGNLGFKKESFCITILLGLKMHLFINGTVVSRYYDTLLG